MYKYNTATATPAVVTSLTRTPKDTAAPIINILIIVLYYYNIIFAGIVYLLSYCRHASMRVIFVYIIYIYM